MKQTIIYLIVTGIILVGLSSCEEMFGDYLEKAPSSDLPDSTVWNNFTYVTYFHNDIYNYQRSGFERIETSWLDAATDLAETSYPWGGVESSLNVGNYYAPGGAPEVNDSWWHYYAGIRKVNMFLERIDSVPLMLGETQTDRDAKVKQLKVEARFLRAAFYWELLIRYGGVPIVTSTLDYENTEALKIPRNSIDECFSFIVNELDAIFPDAPVKHLASAVVMRGRPNQGVILGLKSRVLLYYASPFYNLANDQERWKKAMEASKAFIDFNTTNGNIYKLDNNYHKKITNSAALFNSRTSAELIHYKNLASGDWWKNESPVGYGGIGGLCPTQNLVDMYDMANGEEAITGYNADGSPIINPASGYDDQNPYTGRDPRFYGTILYNGANWWKRNIETFDGGLDKPAGNTDASETGYYMAKFMDETSAHPITGGAVIRNWIYQRYAEILLNYAEAINEYQGPVEEAFTYLELVRARNGKGITAKLPRTLTKDQLRTRIQKERTIEFAFEEHRWWDLRRWKMAEKLGEPIMGMKIIRQINTDGTVTFAYQRIKVEDRFFEERMYLYPIPKTEMYKYPEMGNNPGW